MATLDQFLPWVLPWAVNCPVPVAYQALLDSAREFCARTNIIQQGFTYNGVAGRPDYAVTEPDDLKLNQILRVTWGGNTLAPAAVGDVKLATALRGSVDTATVETGTPRQFYQRTPLEPKIYVWPVPTADAAAASSVLYIKAAFAPYPGATALPDELYDYYDTTIAAGALAIILTQQQAPWENQKLAQTNQRLFETGVAQAKRQALVGRVLGNQRVTARAF